MTHELLACGNIARDVIFDHENFGGSAAAIAVNASRLGISTGLISVVGKDPTSDRYLDFLSKNNINIELVERRLENLPECIISAQPGTAPNIEWVDNGSHEAMNDMKINFKQALKYSVTHLVSCSPGLANALIKSGVKNLSYEPGPYIHTEPACLDFAIIDNSKFLFFNDDEFQAAGEIWGSNSPRDFIGASGRILIITKGAEGSDIYQNTNAGFLSEHIDAIGLNSKIIDSTGAGDCYKTGFLVGYIKGRKLKECALIGSYMGAICLTQEGGILSLDKIAKVKRAFNI